MHVLSPQNLLNASLGGSDACKNEFVRVGGKNMFGAQFHPEETDDGREMLLKFAHT